MSVKLAVRVKDVFSKDVPITGNTVRCKKLIIPNAILKKLFASTIRDFMFQIDIVSTVTTDIDGDIVTSRFKFINEKVYSIDQPDIIINVPFLPIKGINDDTSLLSLVPNSASGFSDFTELSEFTIITNVKGILTYNAIESILICSKLKDNPTHINTLEYCDNKITLSAGTDTDLFSRIASVIVGNNDKPIGAVYTYYTEHEHVITETLYGFNMTLTINTTKNRCTVTGVPISCFICNTDGTYQIDKTVFNSYIISMIHTVDRYLIKQGKTGIIWNIA